MPNEQENIYRMKYDPLEHNPHIVTVNGEPFDPGQSQKVFNHSPDGFAWGYGGSGPAQLALAILLNEGIEPKRAVALHQEFKFEVIAGLPQGGEASFGTKFIDAWLWATEAKESEKENGEHEPKD